MIAAEQNAERTAKAEAMCREYARRLEGNDLNYLLELFTSDARVRSPIFEEQRAKEFYTFILTEISNRSIRVQSVMVSPENPTRAALHARYNRQVTGALPRTIDVVDLFCFTPELDKITDVTIIYDSVKVREDFNFPAFPSS
ncbi:MULTISPECIES: hypothetical protein [Pseudovibrio]|uniref:hypothetical protein n=1 Tax=Stappiaceae TaxID=2821832 RepID=UPI002365B3E0|nr:MULTISPECIES: hypothetical protein [Pseudovibrio]MDD7910991.1 hypothetical protein [Pseudovibrio exalbescens]MDX5593286.1 hypothetical protein [Pseudovibrio sp. SPO723]